MDKELIVVNLSSEVNDLLNYNGLNILQELRRQGLEVERGERPINLQPHEKGTKGVELIILASAVAAPLVGSAVANVLDAIGRNRRPVITVAERKASSITGEDNVPQAEGMERKDSRSIKLSFLGLTVEMGERHDLSK